MSEASDVRMPDIRPRPGAGKAEIAAEIYRALRIEWVSAAHKGDVRREMITAVIGAADDLVAIVLSDAARARRSEPVLGPGRHVTRCDACQKTPDKAPCLEDLLRGTEFEHAFKDKRQQQ